MSKRRVGQRIADGLAASPSAGGSVAVALSWSCVPWRELVVGVEHLPGERTLPPRYALCTRVWYRGAGNLKRGWHTGKGGKRLLFFLLFCFWWGAGGRYFWLEGGSRRGRQRTIDTC